MTDTAHQELGINNLLLTSKILKAERVVVHLSSDLGVPCRYKISIENKDGNFIQWGPIGDECHPLEDTDGQAFATDVRITESEATPIIQRTCHSPIWGPLIG